MYICVCNGVKSEDFLNSVEENESFKSACENHGVGSCCGNCVKKAFEIFEEKKLKNKEVL